MKIQVTQQHIDKGFMGSCTNCPTALALQEHFSNVWVSPDALRLDGKVYPMPDVVSRFLSDFDNKRSVQPFEFELEG